MPNTTAYAASKAALISLAKTLSSELLLIEPFSTMAAPEFKVGRRALIKK